MESRPRVVRRCTQLWESTLKDQLDRGLSVSLTLNRWLGSLFSRSCLGGLLRAKEPAEKHIARDARLTSSLCAGQRFGPIFFFRSVLFHSNPGDKITMRCYLGSLKPCDETIEVSEQENPGTEPPPLRLTPLPDIQSAITNTKPWVSPPTNLPLHMTDPAAQRSVTVNASSIGACQRERDRKKKKTPHRHTDCLTVRSLRLPKLINQTKS